MRRFSPAAFLGLLLAALCLPAGAQQTVSQSLIRFKAATAPGAVSVPAPVYLGSTEYLLFVPAYTTTDPSASIQQFQWQKSADGGTTWTGPDGTSATYYGGPSLSLSLTSGTLRVRCRAKGPDGNVSAWTSAANQTYAAPPAYGTGSVTSVGLSLPAEFSVSGSPVTGSGTLTVTRATQGANQVMAGPTSGGAATPTYRALVAADIPAIPESGVTNLATDLAAKEPGLGNPGTNGFVLASTTGGVRSWVVPPTGVTANQTKGQVTGVFDGGGSALVVGTKIDIRVPYAGTITAATVLADQSGSVAVEVRKCTYAQFDAGSTHPVTGDKISASAPPTISAATKATDATLTGWTTSVSAGDIVEFYVSSATTVQRVSVSLDVTKS